MEEIKNTSAEKSPQNEALCQYCLQPIHEKSKVCHHCGKDQRHFLNKIQYFASAITLLMVVIAAVQTGLSYTQMREMQIKRVEAETVLKESRQAYNTASASSNNAIKKSMDVLNAAKHNSALAKAVIGNAKQEMNNTVNSINEQMAATDERIGKTETGFVDKFDKLHVNIQTVKAQLSSELESLKKRNELTALADKAISEGDRQALNKIMEIYLVSEKSGNEDLAAKSELFRIKAFYISGTRVPNSELAFKNNAGAVLKNSSIPTETLIEDLLNNPDWKVRGRAAQLLASRKEKIVPEAFVESIKSENTLDVLQNSVASFSAVTGYKSLDVFDDLKLIGWWNENKNRVEKDLT